VAREAAAEIRRGTRPSEVAVFYRVNAQSRAVEDALRDLGIPYVLRGALSFYDRAAVRDAMAYLKWFLHPDDAVSLKRLLKKPRRGVGEVTLARAREKARLSGLPLSRELPGIPALAQLLSLRERWLAEAPGRRAGEAFRFLLADAGFLSLSRRGGACGGPGERAGAPALGGSILRGGRGSAPRFPGESLPFRAGHRRGSRRRRPADDPPQRQGARVRRGLPPGNGGGASSALPVRRLGAGGRGGTAPVLRGAYASTRAGVPVRRAPPSALRNVPGHPPLPVSERDSRLPPPR
jgi:hypothetical protein